MKTYRLTINSHQLGYLVDAMDELINIDPDLTDENNKSATAKHFRDLMEKIQKLYDK